jgi:hypothetical protein
VPCFFLSILSPTTYNYPPHSSPFPLPVNNHPSKTPVFLYLSLFRSSLSPYVSLSPTLVFVLLSLCLSLPTTFSFLLFVLSKPSHPLALCMSSTWPSQIHDLTIHRTRNQCPANASSTKYEIVLSLSSALCSVNFLRKIANPPKTYLFPILDTSFSYRSRYLKFLLYIANNPTNPLFCVCFPFVLCSFCHL